MHLASPIPLSLPAYDIVIPTYNRAAQVAHAVESVAAQAHPPTRIIVVDDGSRDETADVLLDLEREYPHLQAVLCPRNAGASAARNAGLALVREPWVAFLDSDDRWIAGAAEALLAASGHLDVVVGHFQRSWPDGELDAPECGWNGEPIRAALARSGAVGPSWAIMRTAAARAVRGFCPSFHNCNDWDFYTRVAANGGRFGRIDAAVALYHYGPSGQLSHDHEIGSVNAARVLAHSWFAEVTA